MLTVMFVYKSERHPRLLASEPLLTIFPSVTWILKGEREEQSFFFSPSRIRDSICYKL
jgi:hypothetical protein